jgi:hypothetical protein
VVLTEELHPTALRKRDVNVHARAIGWNVAVKPLLRETEIVDLFGDILDLQCQLLAWLALDERPSEVEIARVQ